MSYEFKAVEKKWQESWKESGLFQFDSNSSEEKFYTLVMFPYPSGDKLHMGHWYQYGLMDSWVRFQRMQGKRVFFPMGFDAFGLPAENFAIKNGVHPDLSTTRNVTYMREQFERMGVTYHFDYGVDTSKPDYYKWTQWVFSVLYKNGLAYKKAAPVNWCPGCQTVLANEQVQDGKCERSGDEVEQKNLEQWFFKITDYAQRLLDNLDKLDWPHKTKAMQKNWIGRSVGAEVEFDMVDSDYSFRVFTTRPDTLFGCTYVTFAPEHPKVLEFTKDEQRKAVEQYIEQTSKLKEIERLSTTKEKTGVFTGAYAINPVNGEKVPVWISDYVLSTYGTGAVMAVPAHDERDFEFAKTFDLPIKKVVLEEGTKPEDQLEVAFTGDGIAIDSGKYSGMRTAEVKNTITKDLESDGKGEAQVNFRLRDWLVSRQRYWGSPIPVVYCDDCGEVLLEKEDLPVVLPGDVEFKPSGESPLKSCESFLNTQCPKCNQGAKREVDTLDTFVCSSWYYLRFTDPHNEEEAFSKDKVFRLMPVDKYVGGPEHACMHLLYARFINMVLFDQGLVPTEEPFHSLTHQGMILGPDGQKMSKSKGNAVSPDQYVEDYGSDILRLYLAFGFNYVEGGPWSDEGFKSASRFADRVSRMMEDKLGILSTKSLPTQELSKEDKKLLHTFHHSIKGATQDTERFMFNTSVARMMELYNALSDYDRQVGSEDQNQGLLQEVLKTFLILLSPFMPHFCEEFWHRSGETNSVFEQNWPVYEEKYLQLDEISMAVMVNGKKRDEICVSADSDESQVLEVVHASEKVKKYLDGHKLIKHIFVKGKLVNLIIKPA